MYGVAEVHEGRRGHGDDLQHPEADVGDWELPVVADSLTTGLICVAHHLVLFV